MSFEWNPFFLAHSILEKCQKKNRCWIIDFRALFAQSAARMSTPYEKPQRDNNFSFSLCHCLATEQFFLEVLQKTPFQEDCQSKVEQP